MTDEVEIKMTATEQGIVAALEKINNTAQKTANKLNKVEKEATQVRQRMSALGRAGKRAFEETLTPLEKHNRKVSHLNMLLKEGEISRETFNRGVAASKRRLDDATRSTDRGTAAVGQFISRFAGIGTVITGVLTVARAVKSEYEKLLAIQKRNKDSQITAGEAVERLRLNFLPDKSVSTEADLVKRVQDISNKRSIPLKDIEPAAGGVLSAKGDLSNAEALQALDTVLSISNNPEFVAAASAGTLDIAKLTGIKDFKSILGFGRQTQVAARITSPTKLFENLPSIVAAEKQLGGGTAETAAEMLAFLTGQVADPTGEVSRTGSINLIRRLKEFAPQRSFKTKQGKNVRANKALIEKYQNAKTTNERLAILQQNPDLATQFLESADLGKGQLLGAITGLVRGDKRTMAAMADIRGKILAPTDPSQAKRFDAFAAGRAEAPFQQPVNAERRRKQAVERRQLTGKTALADAKEALEDVIENVDLPGVDYFAAKARRTALAHKIKVKGMEPRAAAIEVLEELKTAGEKNLLGGFTAEEKKLIQDEIRILQDIQWQVKQAAAAKRTPAAKNLARAN